MLRLLFFSGLLFLCCRNAARQQHEKKPGVHKAISTEAKEEETPPGTDGPLKTDSLFLQKQISKVIKRVVAQQFSTEYALLADLGLHSGSKRFYLVNLTTKKIIKSGLVTHGSSTTYLPNGQRQYSNTNGSLCSSPGMYKIGDSYTGQFGLAYKLYGLDAGNSNAFARAIVLHSHSCVPDAATEDPICQSWGCPTVSPAFLKTLAGYIDASAKPVLLYIFDSVVMQSSAK